MHGLILSSFISFLDERYDRAGAPEAPFDTDALGRAFGRFAGGHTFAGLYPGFYEQSSGTLAFLLEVERKIHDLVRATIPHSAPPRLHVIPFGDGGVVVTYTSERRLCAMAEGLIEGVADFYGETALIDHSPCMLRGDLACALFVVARPSG